MVGVTQSKLNEQLAGWLQEQPAKDRRPASANPYAMSSTRRLRVRDRLSEQDNAKRIAAFNAGTPKRILAKRYSIGFKSVQKLLREEGVKRKARYAIHP